MGADVRKWSTSGLIAVLVLVLAPSVVVAQGNVSGTLEKWHRVTLTFDGPRTSESASPNPFRDYRLNVTFTKGGRSITVPGYFAADGNAADSGAKSGKKWRVHFVPDETGQWSYTASFRKGSDVAVSTNANAGSAVSFDGAGGTFTVKKSSKSGRDFRAHGLLEHPSGSRYLQFAGSKDYFLKGGADSPENFLGYADFDGTRNLSGGTGDGNLKNGLHHYAPHSGDYRSGDPTWKNGKGKNIIGALNYLADQGMNSVYFLTMNVGGDGRDTWPWTDPKKRDRYDVSKLAQWGIVFHHMNTRGLMMHVVTQETENDSLLNGGSLGVERKLYYRELVARFGWHLAITWNLGEENTNSDSARKAFADYIRKVDPYKHPIVIHTYPGRYDGVYNPLLGHGSFDGPSLQVSKGNAHDETKKWIDKSSQNGPQWFVSVDEIGPASKGVSSDDSSGNNHDEVRKKALWGNLMAGGAGVEWYFGYATTWSKRPGGNKRSNDITCEDWRSRQGMWDDTRIALEFFQKHIPFEQMHADDGLTPDGDDWVLAQPGVVYAIYLPDGGTPKVNLSGGGPYEVRWYDPRNGGSLKTGGKSQVSGSGMQSLGSPPAKANQDWVALLRTKGSQKTYQLTVNKGSGDGMYPKGAKVTVKADAAPSGKIFKSWTGDTSILADPTKKSTTATMPGNNATITATYEMGASGPRVERFSLIDADSDSPISVYDPMPQSTTLNLAKLPTKNLNLQAHTNPSDVGSVEFLIDGNAEQTENVAPYAIAGDNSGDFNNWTPPMGMHTFEATPYPEEDAGGMAGVPASIDVDVIDDGSKNAPPVVIIEKPTDGAAFTAPATLDVRVKAADIDGTVDTVDLSADMGSATSGSKMSGGWHGQVGPLNAGNHTIEAVATDDSGGTATATVDITVTSGMGTADAGSNADAGSQTDSGASVGNDGGTTGSESDTATGKSGGAKGGGKEGCGCTAASERSFPVSLFAFALLLVALRRRD